MTEITPERRIPVTVLTGFLGAGKTRLLNRLIAVPGFGATAVVINEFGEIGIDADLVETADARAFAMTTGCLCCTVAGDIRLTLLRLAEAAAAGTGPAFDRLVIETTGLADPAPVLQALMTSDLVIDRYALNGVVTLVDAVAGADTLDRFAEARRQAGVADLIVLSKTDLATGEATASLTARLRALAPNARLCDADATGPGDVFGLAAFDPCLKPPAVADWLRFETAGSHPHRPGHTHTHGSDVVAHCVRGGTALNPWDVQDAIEALQARLGPDLLRLKAICMLDEDPETPVVLHAVQHVLHPPTRLKAWPAGPRDSRIVVIACGPEAGAVPAILARHLPALHAPAAAPAA